MAVLRRKALQISVTGWAGWSGVQWMRSGCGVYYCASEQDQTRCTAVRSTATRWSTASWRSVLTAPVRRSSAPWVRLVIKQFEFFGSVSDVIARVDQFLRPDRTHDNMKTNLSMMLVPKASRKVCKQLLVNCLNSWKRFGLYQIFRPDPTRPYPTIWWTRPMTNSGTGFTSTASQL